MAFSLNSYDTGLNITVKNNRKLFLDRYVEIEDKYDGSKEKFQLFSKLI